MRTEPVALSPRLQAMRAALCFGAAGVLVAGLLGVGATPAAVALVVAPWDKLAHLATFATLATLLLAGFGGRRPVLSVVLACFVGIVDETMQGFNPGRHADLADLAADATGALLAVTLLWLLWGRRG